MRPDVLIETFVKRIFRNYIYPQFEELADSGIITDDPILFLRNLLGFDILKADYDGYGKEWLKLNEELNERRKTKSIEFPKDYDSQLTNTYAVYVLVRKIRPKIIVETGVANGVSSFFILNAIKRNCEGQLVSFDINEKAGSLLNDEERQLWNFLKLDKVNKREFKELFSHIENIDIFIHDSDHSYKWQKFEYLSALSRMRDGSFLLSDDVDSSYAFIDVVSKFDSELRINFLIGKTRFF